VPRYKLIIEYDGAPYAGWQSQANARAVQDAVEDAIERVSGARPRLTAAGRTPISTRNGAATLCATRSTRI